MAISSEIYMPPNKPLEWTGLQLLSAAPPIAHCLPLRGSVGQRVRAALPADIDSMAGTAGSLNLRIWADQGMQARATGPRHMAVRGSRLRYACRPMGNDPPESHHNQGHPDLHARSTVHTRRSEVASGGFTEPPTL